MKIKMNQKLAWRISFGCIVAFIGLFVLYVIVSAAASIDLTKYWILDLLFWLLGIVACIFVLLALIYSYLENKKNPPKKPSAKPPVSHAKKD
jgi:uncharacterized BrkB/YihY/UPF0761 family membrane protein